MYRGWTASKLVTCEPEGPPGRLWSATDVTKLRTLIASNDQTFRHLLAGYMQLLDPCIDLVGEATTTAETLLALGDQGQELDLVLLDLSLQPGNPLGLVARIRRMSSTAVVVIGPQPAAEYREAAIAVGALDYVDVFELSTALPAALGRAPGLNGPCQPIEQPVEVSKPEKSQRTAPASRRTKPNRPKRCLFTAWQYVHFGLALAIGTMVLARVQAPGMRWRMVLLLCLVGVAVLEARQLAMAHRTEKSPKYR